MLAAHDGFLAGWFIAPEPRSEVRADLTNQRCVQRYCTLTHLSGRLYLWSLQTVNDTSLLRHFVHHYAALGVRTSHMTFVFDGPPSGGALPHGWWHEHAGQVRRVLRDIAPGSSVRTTPGGYQTHGDEHKRDAVNAHIQSLPADAWLIYADSDEFFRFPCSASPAPTCGTMVDRLPPNISHRAQIPNVDQTQPLHRQFPRCATVRSSLQGAYARKFILLPARRVDGKAMELADSHNVRRLGSQGDAGVRCAAEGEISHYTMSSEQATGAQHKWWLYNQLATRKNWTMRQRSDLAWPYRRFFRLFEGMTNSLISNRGATFRLSARGAQMISRTLVCCPAETDHDL
jgi:hypothetical protein